MLPLVSHASEVGCLNSLVHSICTGLVIVMSEALSDDSVFSLLMVGTVWEVDQFYSIYCKQETSKIYLPWYVVM